VGVWLYRLLGISTFGLFFLENDMLASYKNSEYQKFPSQQGIAGYSFQNQKTLIISDIKSSAYYDKFIDIFSHLPLYVTPLIE